MYENLSITSGAEHMAAPFQLRPEGLEVEYLAIEYHTDSTILVVHRLLGIVR
jgi:hypothetical protein